MKHKNALLGFILAILSIFSIGMPAFSAIAFPNISIGMQTANTPQEFTQGVQIMILLTILTLAPSIIIMTTAFIRIVIVLALTRQAIGTTTLPPNQIIAGLAIILTFFIMSPTINKINETAIQPYLKNQITQNVALEGLFISMAKMEKPKTAKDVETYILVPAFVLSELKTAFKIGFVIFLPFLVIDIVVASILVSMGMLFLPPATVATPFKLILFVMVDGWYLITKSLIEGFIT